MPLTSAFASRRAWDMEPEENEAVIQERVLKSIELLDVSFSRVLKANPYHDAEGYFTSKEKSVGNPKDKDHRRIADMQAKSTSATGEFSHEKMAKLATTMAKSITTWDKAHARANAALAAGHKDVAKIFRDRAMAIRTARATHGLTAVPGTGGVPITPKPIAAAAGSVPKPPTETVVAPKASEAAPPKKATSKLNPDEISADKMLTHLKKEYGGEAGYHGVSNPYSDYQHRSAKLTPEQAKRLAADLENAGWEKNSGNVNEAYKDRVFNFENKHNAGMRIDIVDGRVGIYGLKKAKAKTIAYYD